MSKRNTISENQLSLPFGSERAISYPNRAIFFWFMAGIVVTAFCLYIYAVNITARHIAERQNLERKVADISARLNTLEFEYIEARNEVTMELAHQHGFKEAKSPLYVSRSSQTALSFNSIDR